MKYKVPVKSCFMKGIKCTRIKTFVRISKGSKRVAMIPESMYIYTLESKDRDYDWESKRRKLSNFFPFYVVS